MILFMVAVILTLICLLGITLRKTYLYLPAKELKRQARRGDQVAATLYKAAAYGPNLRILLWAVIGLSAAGSFSIMARLAPIWLGFICITLVLIYGFAWLPSGRLTSFGARLAIWFTPLIEWMLVKLHPLLRATANLLGKHRQHLDHSGLYEVDDIVDLLENQKKQSDSRISEDILDVLLHTLRFNQMNVSDVLTPRHAVVAVHAADTIGPIVMDELHESGHTHFPVLDSGNEPVGMLYLKDVLENTHGDKVSTVMKKDLQYIHEDHPLEQALHAMMQASQPTLIVVNSKEEYVGTIGLEAVVEQMLGHKLTADFDQYSDKAAVAAATVLPEPQQEEVAELEPTPEAKTEAESDPESDEPVSEKPQEVIE